MPAAIPLAVAGASVAGAAISANAAKKGASTQANAQLYAAEQQRQQQEQARADLYPWVNTGQTAQITLAGLVPGLTKPFTPEDLTNEPGYQFTLGEGEKAINRGAAARGMWASAPTLKELSRFNQGLAGTTYQNAFNRDLTNRQNTYNMYMGLSGLGENAAAQTGNQAVAFGNMIGNNTAGAGASQGAGSVAAGNAWGSALSGTGQNLLDYYTLNSLMNRPTLGGTSYSQANPWPTGAWGY